MPSYLSRLVEKVQKDAGEVVCVVVRVPQLIGQSIEEEVTSFCVQVTSQAHENIQRGLVHGVALGPRLVLVDGLHSTHGYQANFASQIMMLRCNLASCHNETLTIMLLTNKDDRPDMSFHQSVHNDRLVMMTLTLVQITHMIRLFAQVCSI